MRKKESSSFERKYRILLWKRYFEQGYNNTQYFKYLILFFGLASRDVPSTMGFGFAYLMFCFIFGWAWFRYGLYEAEIEIGNRFNLFVKEMRKSINRKV